MEPGVNERIEQMLRSFRQTRQKLSELNARARETQGWAASRDNLITCTVTSGAGITDLTISPRALERYDAATLADTIRGVIAEANAQLQANLTDQYREVLGEGFDPHALADPEAAEAAVQDMARRLRGE